MVIGLISFFTGVFQLVISVFQFSRIEEQKSFLQKMAQTSFSVLFCAFNLMFVLESSVLELSLGLVIATLFFYLTFASVLDQNRTHKSIGILIAGSVITISLYLILSFGIKVNSHEGVLLIPIIMAFYFVFGAVLSLNTKIQKSVNLNSLFSQGAVAFIFMIFVVLAFTLENSRFSFFISLNIFFVAFLYQFVLDSRSFLHEKKKFSVKPNIELVNLTKMESTVARHLLEGKSPQEIADLIGRSKDVVYKHASNCYKKTNTEDRTAFVLRFGDKNDDRFTL